MYKYAEMPGDGQSMVETGLIIALVSVVAIVALTNIGTQIKTAFETVRDNLTTANNTSHLTAHNS